MIYTKTGDEGMTSLVGGTRVKKYDIRVETYGEMDQLVALLGYITTYLPKEKEIFDIVTIQHHLFVIESIVACEKDEWLEKMSKIRETDVEFLERKIDEMSEQMPPLKNFIIPSKSRTATLLHYAATQTRRCERLLVECNDTYPQNPIILKYINRLSDYLFTLARYTMKKKNLTETFYREM